MGKVLFSQVCVCSHPGKGVLHLHPIILPLILCPFQGYLPFPSHRGTPVPGWGYPSPRQGVPQYQVEHTPVPDREYPCPDISPARTGVPPSQDRTGVTPTWECGTSQTRTVLRYSTPTPSPPPGQDRTAVPPPPKPVLRYPQPPNYYKAEVPPPLPRPAERVLATPLALMQDFLVVWDFYKSQPKCYECTVAVQPEIYDSHQVHFKVTIIERWPD